MVWLPEGSDIKATTKVVKRLEKHLAREKKIARYTAFIGKGAPRFELGLNPEAQAPNYALLVVNTHDKGDTPGLIAKLQLKRIEKRVVTNHKVPFSYDDDVIKLIVERCTELESGGRMIDAILTNTVLPSISNEFLKRMLEGQAIERVHVKVKDGAFDYAFE